MIAAADNGVAIVAGGDELTLRFSTDLPAPSAGMTRDFFLFTVGWDKDADYHVARGTMIEPLPWAGMDDQRHGREVRPAFPSDALQERFTTRWVGDRTYSRKR